jgi:glycosyltransferase involved in cell wall biosynthesis
MERKLCPVLEAYCRLAVPPDGWRLLVVDNGSTDGTAELLASYSRLCLRRLHEPQPGKNRALNRALAEALAMPFDIDGLFVFTDDDATPAPDWLLQWHARRRPSRLQHFWRRHPA